MKIAGSFKRFPIIWKQPNQPELKKLQAILALDEARGRERYAIKLAEAGVDIETARTLLAEVPRMH